MSKTTKYQLGISTFNTDYVFIDINKKQYNQLLTKYKQHVNEYNSIDDEWYKEQSDFYVEINEETEEYDHHIEYNAIFRDEGTYITLKRLVCKKGYYFRK